MPPGFKKMAKITLRGIQLVNKSIELETIANKAYNTAALAARELDITTSEALAAEDAPGYTPQMAKQYKAELKQAKKALKVANKSENVALKNASAERKVIKNVEFKDMLQERAKALLFEPMRGGTTEDTLGGIFEMTGLRGFLKGDKLQIVTRLTSKISQFLHHAEGLPHGPETTVKPKVELQDILNAAQKTEDPEAYLTKIVKEESVQFEKEQELGEGDAANSKWFEQWSGSDKDLPEGAMDGIRNYFDGKNDFKNLQDIEKDMIESLWMTDDQMTTKFGMEEGKMREFRTIMENDLLNENAIPLESLKQWKLTRSGSGETPGGLTEKRPVDAVEMKDMLTMRYGK